jgi:signal transduction histidine kinase
MVITYQRSAILRYSVAVAATLVATVLRLFLESVLGDRSPLIMMAGAVVFSAWFGGYGPGLLSMTLGLVAIDYLFIGPAYSLVVATRAELAMLAQFVLLCLMMILIIEQLHRAGRRLSEAAEGLRQANLGLESARLAILKANERLRESNEDLQRFAYAASHDLQEPLRMVASYSRLLVRSNAGRLDADSEEFAHYIEQGVRRMQVLITDLLEFSRVSNEPAQAELVDSHEVLTWVLDSLKTAIEESGARITVDAQLPPVRMNRSRLSQLFQNLIGNAIKYRGEQPPVIHIGAQGDETHVRFSVRDNGMGIDPAYHDRIFGLFQRLHGAQEYPGTGIGLAVAKRIVERHGGRIWVDSRAGSGSTFYFTVPAASSVAAPPPPR